MNGREIAAIDPFASRFDGDDEIGFDESDASKASDSIRSVTRSPYTAAVIGATAAVAPPVGTAVAGVMTAAVGYAEVVATALKPAAKIVGAAKKIGFNPIKRRKSKRRKSSSGTSFATKVRGMSDDQLSVTISQYSKMTRYSPQFTVMLKVMQAEQQRRAALKSTAAKAAAGTDAKSRSDVKASAKEIAKLIIKAKRGDKKAEAAVIAIENMASGPMQGSFIFRVARMRGLDNATAKQIAVGLAKGSDMTKAWKLGNALAERMGVKRKKTPKKVLAVQKKAARELATPTDRKGVLVTASMVKSRGKFKRSSKGRKGWLVGPKGMVTAGKWA